MGGGLYWWRPRFSRLTGLESESFRGRFWASVWWPCWVVLRCDSRLTVYSPVAVVFFCRVWWSWTRGTISGEKESYPTGRPSEHVGVLWYHTIRSSTGACTGEGGLAPGSETKLYLGCFSKDAGNSRYGLSFISAVHPAMPGFHSNPGCISYFALDIY